MLTTMYYKIELSKKNTQNIVLLKYFLKDKQNI